VGLLHDISEYRAFTENMKQAIERAGCGKNNLVFIIQDLCVPDAASGKNAFYLKLFQLEPDGNDQWKLKEVQGLVFDNRDRNCWEKAFEFIYTGYRSKRNMLITFSHGAAFGIGRDMSGTIRLAAAESLVQRPAFSDWDQSGPDKASLPKPGSDAIQVVYADYHLADNEIRDLEKEHLFQDKRTGDDTSKGFIRKNPDTGICASLEITWISDLADALDKYLPAYACIDVLIMANCFMQVFDNGYILCRKVKFLVAPEGALDATGYDYFTLLNRLNRDPEITNRNLVRKIVKDFQTMYIALGKKDTLATTALFANSLKFYPIALMVFEAFLDLLMKKMDDPGIKDELIRGLKDIRENRVKSVTGSQGYQLVDAGLWIKLVAERFATVDNMPMFNTSFRLLHKKIAVAHLVGNQIRRDDEKFPVQFGYSGISVYYPLDNAHHKNQDVTWCAYFDKNIPTTFKRDSKFDEFLDKYFKAIQSLTTAPAPPTIQEPAF
jgi:Clostripain family